MRDAAEKAEKEKNEEDRKALRTSALDPLRTFARTSTANPNASAEAPYASSRSSASRHFICAYPSHNRIRLAAQGKAVTPAMAAGITDRQECYS
jgi:hypothetical protein